MGLELTFATVTIEFTGYTGSHTGSAVTAVPTTQQFWIAGYGATNLGNVSSVLYVGPTASVGLWAVNVGVVTTADPTNFDVSFYSL
jgi:hypothetical protein